MSMFARRIALPLALLIALAGSSFAAGAKVDGRAARGAVQKNRAQRGLSTKVKVTAVRDSKSGKSVQVLSEVIGTGKVEAYNVNKKTKVARRTPTGLVSQKAAEGKANQKLRRGNGTFAGAQAEGLSARGNYKFGSKTDRTDRVFVNPTTGRAAKYEK